MGETRMAGKATREKMRGEGVDPAICDQPGLTMEEAYDAIYAVRRAKEMEGCRAQLREVGHPRADDPSLTLEDARHLSWDIESELIARRCGPPPEPTSDGRVFIAKRDSRGETEVVGESHYLKDLRAIFTRRKVAEGEALAWAVLVPEPSNPHDQNAVAVWIDGCKVGYLSRADAAACADDLNAFARTGQYVTCPSRLGGGSSGFIGVRLQWYTGDSPSVATKAAAPRGRPGARIPVLTHICTACRSTGKPGANTPGSTAVELLLWLFFCLPGLVYSAWRLGSRTIRCRTCGHPGVIPIATPEGRRLYKESTGLELPPHTPVASTRPPMSIASIALVAVFVLFGAPCFLAFIFDGPWRDQPASTAARTAPAASPPPVHHSAWLHEDLDGRSFFAEKGNIHIFEAAQYTPGTRAIIQDSPFGFFIQSTSEELKAGTVFKATFILPDGTTFDGYFSRIGAGTLHVTEQTPEAIKARLNLP